MTAHSRIEWSRQVKEADLYTCQRCGDRGHVEAHHITPVYVDRHKELDLDNGVTLCRQCHKAAHGGYFYRPSGTGWSRPVKTKPLAGWYGIAGHDKATALEHERTFVLLPKGAAKTIQVAADQAGESVNKYTQNAILQRMGLSKWPVLEGDQEEANT